MKPAAIHPKGYFLSLALGFALSILSARLCLAEVEGKRVWGSTWQSPHLLTSSLVLCYIPGVNCPTLHLGPGWLQSTQRHLTQRWSWRFPSLPILAEGCLAVCQGAGVKMLRKASGWPSYCLYLCPSVEWLEASQQQNTSETMESSQGLDHRNPGSWRLKSLHLALWRHL